MNRRKFIRHTLAGMATLLVTDAFVQHQTYANSSKNCVRIAFLGVGDRGLHLLKLLLKLSGWNCTAICDINKSHLENALNLVEAKQGHRPSGYSKGQFDYKSMIKRDDIDAVLIATPMMQHAQQSIDCMLANKHVGVEVPGAFTLDECWSLIKTKEETGVHYMLLENCNYMCENMLVSNMIKKGMLGQPYSAECSYIHDGKSLIFDSAGDLTWRGKMCRDNFGCQYPTHAVGPISKWLNINKGDRMVRLTSYVSKPLAIHDYCITAFGKDSHQAKIQWKFGDFCSTQIQTANGNLINIQYDTVSSRPFDCFYLIQGTKGIYDSRKGIYISGKDNPDQWSPANTYINEFSDELWKTLNKEVAPLGHGGSDYFVVRDFLQMLLANREPWIDVYDSATWSAIVELSQKSILNNNQSVDFPDFTKGKWQHIV